MTVRATPRLRIALLNWFLDNNEPLAGDLIEECAHRSRTWFWSQLMFALLARTAAGAAAALRDPARLIAPLASLAMFMVLCFQVVVAGSLLASVLPRTRVVGHEWLAVVVFLSLPVGWGTGNVTRRLHARSRVATVVLCGASAAVNRAIRSELPAQLLEHAQQRNALHPDAGANIRDPGLLGTAAGPLRGNDG